MKKRSRIADKGCYSAVMVDPRLTVAAIPKTCDDTNEMFGSVTSEAFLG
jgi:hypothetical protein